MTLLRYIPHIIIALANVGAIVWLCYCEYPVMNTIMIIGMLIVNCTAYDTMND